jgi:hypothetical protein
MHVDKRNREAMKIASCSVQTMHERGETKRNYRHIAMVPGGITPNHTSSVPTQAWECNWSSVQTMHKALGVTNCVGTTQTMRKINQKT